jgi:V-type H+-transporting ATPase subunit a
MYPFGLDPVWGLANNRLTITNNIKMKLSVIFGVLHMTMGVLVKGTNEIYFKRWPALVFEVFAGLIILLGLFGWMDLLIFAKWLFPLNYADLTIDRTVTPNVFVGEAINRKAPSIINIMINTVFGGG